MGKDANTIRKEIELTRGRMGDAVEALAYKADVPSRMKDSVDQQVEAAKDTIGDVVENVKATIGGVGDAAAAASQSSVDAISDARGKLRDRAAGINDRVSDGLLSADLPGSARQAVDAIQENPIGLALAALSIGFLTGSLLPISEIERKRLQPIRTKIVDQAQAATSDLVEAGKAVVRETAQTAVTSALNSAQSHGQEVVDAAKARAAQN